MPYETTKKFVPERGGPVKDGAISGRIETTTTYWPEPWKHGESPPRRSSGARFALPESVTTYLALSFFCGAWIWALQYFFLGYADPPLGRSFLLGLVAAIPIALFKEELGPAFAIANALAFLFCLGSAASRESGTEIPYYGQMGFLVSVAAGVLYAGAWKLFRKKGL